jgi:hypothetical protein
MEDPSDRKVVPYEKLQFEILINKMHRELKTMEQRIRTSGRSPASIVR